MSDSDSTMEETPRRYRNPPIEHRFRKGVSGNPRGRPRKERKIGGQPRVGFEERVKSLAIEEAYRIIKIREGDRVEKVPVIQAIIRKIAVAAANGNTRAQLSYLNLLTGAEADRRMATEELLKNNKEHWGRVLAERVCSGATGPEPVPHPRDSPFGSVVHRDLSGQRGHAVVQFSGLPPIDANMTLLCVICQRACSKSKRSLTRSIMVRVAATSAVQRAGEASTSTVIAALVSIR
jgi:Family of unknown function (DUF5681)